MTKLSNIGESCYITTGKIDSNEAVPDGRYPFFTCAEFPERIDSFAFDDDVVLIAGNNAHGNFHVSRYKGKFNAYQRTYILTARKGICLDYIYYALKLELKRLREKSQGSQTKFLTIDIIKDIVLNNLEYVEQVGISSLLSKIDKKFALNQKIINELKAVASQIYDYWFVQFDFPNKNGNPYKTSGEEMIFNEALKCEIPKDWDVRKLGDVIPTVLGGTPSTENESNWANGSISWLSSSEIENFPISFSEKKISQEGIKNSAAEVLPKGSVLISIVRHLRVSILAINSSFNQSVVGLIETDNLKRCFLYPWLNRELPRLMTLRTGAQQPHINKELVDDSLITIPPDSLLDKYTEIVTPIFDQIDCISIENINLQNLRNWLLPMLMNGQVKVRNKI